MPQLLTRKGRSVAAVTALLVLIGLLAVAGGVPRASASPPDRSDSPARPLTSAAPATPTAARESRCRAAWQVEYFRKARQTGRPAAVRCVKSIAATYAAGSHPAGVRALRTERLSARWTQTRRFARATYEFRLRADDQAVVRVDGRVVVRDARDASNTYRVGARTLSAGRHQVVVVHRNRSKGASVQLDVVRRPDRTGPSAVTALVGRAGDRTVSLSWRAPRDLDVAGYRVLRGVDARRAAGRTTARLLPAPTYRDDTVRNGVAYTYAVVPYDRAGNPGTPREVTVTPRDTAAPAAPTALTAVGGDGQVALAWHRSGSPDVAAYRVFRAVVGGPLAWRPVATVAGTRWTDDKVTNGTAYVYYVVAVDDDKRVSGWSNLAGDTPSGPREPVTPTALVATARDGEVQLDWAYAGDQAEIDGFRLYRSDDGSAPSAGGTPLAQVSADKRSHVDKGLVNGTTYTYVVVAYRGDRASDPSQPAHATPNDKTPPAAPNGLVAEAGENVVHLEWDAVADATSYRVFRREGDGPVEATGSPLATPTTTSYDDLTAVNGTTYSYVVVAVDGSANVSAPSERATATPGDATAPEPPTTLVATPSDGAVSLAWQASTSSDTVGYVVLRAQGSADPQPVSGATPLAGTTYTDDDVENGTAYTYTVVAVDEAGNESEPSDPATATPADTTAPDAPQGLTATAGNATVTLAWDAVAGDTAGYRVYRAEAPDVPVTGTPLSGDDLVTDTEWTDDTVVNGTRYHYVVTAVDEADNESAPSEPADATPTGPPPADVHEKVVFQPTTGEAISGYTRDTGAAWTDAAGRGFVREDSLDDATHVPLDLTRNTRYRTARTGVTQLQRSLVHLQYGTSTSPNPSSGVLDSGAWELAVPNGRYTVKVSVGDEPSSTNGYDSQHSVNVEGSAAIDRFQASAGQEFRTAVVTVTVADGRLTVDATGGRNTKLNYVEVDTAVDTPTIDESFVFQPDTAPVPSGFTKDIGSAWTDAAGRGWVRQDSLSAATHVPLDLTRNTRLRTRTGVTDLQNRLIHLQYGASTNPNPANGVLDSGAWELAVPNGRYTVTASVGDQMGSTSYDSVHQVNVEGVAAVDHFQATAANEYLVGSATASVTDGRLTLDAVGGTNTKLNWVRVQTAGDEPAAPDVRVNFSDEATAPPAGYVQDFGQAYGARTGTSQGSGLTYGWIQQGTSTPVSLVGNGRNRNTGTPPANQPDLRLATFLHMQLPSNATGGVSTPGSWELAVPAGTYEVVVAVGDAGTAVDSENWINVEGQNAIAAFVPTAATKHATAQRTVRVTDGRLTLTALSGTNTKIDYVTVHPVAGTADRPAVRTTTPGNRATGVPLTTSVVADLDLPRGGVDPASLDTTTVTLTNVLTGAPVPAGVATSGGGDTVNISPTQPLAANTLYRFTVTDGVRDVAGGQFLPYSSVFTTGGGTTGGGSIAFDKSDSGAPKGAMYTSVVVGPDGRLYAGSILGDIYRFDIAADGTLGNRTTISTVRSYSNSAASGDTYNKGTRTVIGLAFDPASTPTDPILWITDDAPYLGPLNVPDFTGRIARLSGPDLGTYTAVVEHLPRSVKDHETNSLAFGPDGALYVNQGANNAMGQADSTWANRNEHLLTAAVLRLDVAHLPPTLPLDVKTDEGGTYNPYAVGALLTVYASGVRNAFDLVWHSNGHLYVPTNGSAAGGNTPATPNPLPASCANRPDGGYTGGTVPGITNNPNAETDYVFDVKRGRYYGHPNPSRCEYVLAGGNPTSGNDPFETAAYPVGTRPDPNLDLAGMYDAGLHASANGAVEYRGGAFGGALRGKLLVVRYSSGQDIETFDVAANGALSNRTTGDKIPGFSGFTQPLDVTEDQRTGNLYVTQLTDNSANTSIALLRPRVSTAPPAVTTTSRLVLSGVVGTQSAAQQVTITNSGGGTLTIPQGGLTVGGVNAGEFALGATTLPVSLASGESITVPVRFTPGATAGVKSATLTVAPTGATAAVTTLRGLAATGLGGGNEPSLQRILDTWQIPVNVGDPNPADNSLPTTAPLGDEIAAQTFTKLEDDAPITITPIAAYGPQDDDPAIGVGWYAAGAGGDRHEQFTVAAAQAQGLVIAPTGTTTNIDPGTGSFGLFSRWPFFSGRVVYGEDALNTFDPTVAHHVRVYPYKTAAGAVVPGSYVVATEETTSGQDYQDVVLVVTNVQPQVATAPGARVALANADGVPYDDRLAFSRIQTPNTSTGTTQRTHDTASVTVRNTGTEAMQVTDLAVTGPFELVTPPTLPLAVAAGGSTTLTVRFTATSGDVRTGSLRIVTNAGTNPTPTVELAGFWQSQSENNQEPSVREMAQVFGYTTDIPSVLNAQGAVVAVGDEVLSPYWKAVNTAQPVVVRQLAGFHTFPNGATVFRHNKGTTSTTTVLNMNGAWAQSILPPASGSTTSPAQGSFTTTSTFGFKIDSEWSDDTRNDQNADHANGCVGACGHHVRFFPVKDRAGAVVTGSYLMMMDYSGINYDYNDNVYLVTNVRPETPSAPRGVTAEAGDGRVTARWAANPEPGVSYDVWRGTTPAVDTSGTPLNGATHLSATSFVDTTVTNGTTYYYVVKARYADGATSAASTSVAAVPVSASAYRLEVNFTTRDGALPTGYLRDYGQAYGARTGAGQGSGNSYGWVVPGTQTGRDLSVGGTTNVGNGRVRGIDADLRTDSFMHMQGDTVPNFNGTPLPGAWELAVPNGRYTVTVAVGDAKVGSDPESHTLHVEGVTAIDGFVPSGGDGAATRHRTATVTVDVADGRLTLDALGGTNTKIDYIDVIGLAG